MIRLEGVVARYATGETVLKGLDLHVARGELFALLGPSGSGKTTALRVIAGFEPVQAGRVLLRGEVVQDAARCDPPERRGLGYVFQEHALFPHLRVKDNVAFGLQGLPRGDRASSVEETLHLVGLGGLGGRWVHELSGGERQRVALARALAPRPPLLLLDEPFDSLDAGLRESIRRRVRGLLREWGTTAVLVTHDQQEALVFADRIAILHRGHLEQVGAPEELYGSPATPFVAAFLGDTNFLEGVADGVGARTPLGPVRLDREASGRVTLSLRPEHLHLDAALEGRECGEVVSREFKGHDVTLRVALGDRLYTVQADYQCPFRVGERVRLLPKEPAVVLRERNGR